MKADKWTHPAIPLPVLALKLCEEAAEVGNVITDNYMGAISAGDARDQIEEELLHVEFIVKAIRGKLGAREFRPGLTR